MKKLLAAGGLAFCLIVTAPALPQQSDAAVPDRSEAYFHFALGHLYQQLAMQFVRQEYVTRAIDEYKLAVEADPESSYIRRELIQLYASTNKLDEAVEEAEAVLEKDPKNFEIHRLLGRVYRNYATDSRGSFNEEMLAKAIEHYEQALEIEPDDLETLQGLSPLYRAAGEPDKSSALLEKILSVKPNDPSALQDLAALHLESGDTEKAIATLEKLASGGEDFDPRRARLLGGAYQQAGRHKEAAKIYQDLLEFVVNARGNTVPVRQELAYNLLLAGDYAEAQKEYEALAEADPRNSDYHLRLSQIHRERRRFSDARDSLRKAGELAPDSVQIKYEGVILLEREGRIEAATAALESILDETEKARYAPREQTMRSVFLEHLGGLYTQQEQFDKARETYSRIAEAEPEAEPRVRTLLVENRRAARDFEGALEESKKAVDDFPKNRPLLMQRSGILAETGSSNDAAKVLEKLLDGGPGDLEIYTNLAHVHEKGKDYDKAEEAVQKAFDLTKTPIQKQAILFTYGSILERAKRFDESEGKFRELLELAPDNAGALNYLGYMLADIGVKLDEAHDMIQRALDLEPDNGAYLDSLGWVYFRQEKLQLAERYLLKSLEQIKRDPVVHTHLGDVYSKLGNNERAQEHWEKGLDEWRSSPAADRDPAEIAKLRKKLEDIGVNVSQADEDDKSQKKRKNKKRQ